MAIAVTSTKKTVFGNKKIMFITGTFANGDTSGTVATGLNSVDFISVQYQALAKIIGGSASGGTVTLTTEDPGATKTWTMMVVGH
jgi:hypothetical protein